ncbi:MAG: hypothetical protein ACLP0A_12305 [Verrucomicrobiia bacterium]
MKMKTTHCTSIVIAALALAASAGRLPAAVNVNTAEPIETIVAFRVAANKYISTTPSNSLGLVGGKFGSKQTFTIIDITGGNLQDGDEVRVRYTPHAKSGEVAKSSYWVENNAGVRRSHDGDVFKLKRVDTKFALVTPTRKFVAAPTSQIALGVSAKQDDALLVEIIDVKSGASVIKPADQPAAAPTNATPPSTPEKTEAATPAPPPATDKPATQ